MSLKISSKNSNSSVTRDLPESFLDALGTNHLCRETYWVENKIKRLQNCDSLLKEQFQSIPNICYKMAAKNEFTQAFGERMFKNSQTRLIFDIFYSYLYK